MALVSVSWQLERHEDGCNKIEVFPIPVHALSRHLYMTALSNVLLAGDSS